MGLFKAYIGFHLDHAALQCQKFLRDCVCLYVNVTYLLLKSVSLGFLGFAGSLNVTTDTHLIIEQRLLSVCDSHGEKGLQGVFLSSDYGNLLAMILDLCQDVLKFVL